MFLIDVGLSELETFTVNAATGYNSNHAAFLIYQWVALMGWASTLAIKPETYNLGPTRLLVVDESRLSHDSE